MHVTESWKRIWNVVLCPKKTFSGKALKKKALKVLMYKKGILNSHQVERKSSLWSLICGMSNPQHRTGTHTHLSRSPIPCQHSSPLSLVLPAPLSLVPSDLELLKVIPGVAGCSSQPLMLLCMSAFPARHPPTYSWHKTWTIFSKKK